MGKKTKTKLPLKQISARNLVDKESQTDELERLSREITTVDEATNVPTSSTDFCDLTKEQLILRLRIAQELNSRQQRALEKSESFRKQQKQVIQELCHKVKMLVMEHRDNHSEFKRIIANLVTVFVNGRKELGERLKELRITAEDDRKQIRDSMASNEVATAKAKNSVKQANNEINEMLKQLEKMQLKVEKVEKDRVFIKQQYDELVDKRNQQIITQDFLCPKCKATKKCLDDVLEDLKSMRDMKRKFEEDSKNFQRLHNDGELKLKEMEKMQKRLIHERDTYKEHLKSMEKKSSKKNINNSIVNSPVCDGNICNGKLEGTPSLLTVVNSPQKKSETNSPETKHSNKQSPKNPNLEDGEVVEDEDQESESQKGTKRSAEESPVRNKKPKTIDYVYIIDEEPPPLMALDLSPVPNHNMNVNNNLNSNQNPIHQKYPNQSHMNPRNPSPNVMRPRNHNPNSINQRGPNPNPHFMNPRNPNPNLMNPRNPNPNLMNPRNPSPGLMSHRNPNSSPMFQKDPNFSPNPMNHRNLNPGALYQKDPIPMHQMNPNPGPMHQKGPEPRTSWRSMSPERLQVPSLYPDVPPRRPGYPLGCSPPRRLSPTPGPSEVFYRSPTYPISQNSGDQYGNPGPRYRPPGSSGNGVLPWHDPNRQSQQRFSNRSESWTGWRR